MTIENLMERIKIFSGKVKAALNIATILFLAAMGCTISQWHKASSFDNLSNVLLTFMMLIINIKFYKIHLSLNSIVEYSEESRILSAYKNQKNEYSQLVLMSLLMFVIIFVLKLLLS